MGSDKYYKIKNRIDFYLNEKGVTDFSNYILDRHVLVDNEINIIQWGYIDIPKPTYDELKTLCSKPNFIDHRNKNMLLLKLKFILKIKFDPGEYKRGDMIYDKYKDYPYIWFINLQDTSIVTPTDLIQFKVKNSVLYINNDFTITQVNNVYLRCVLVSKKDIDTNNKYVVNVIPNSLPSTSMNSEQVEIPNNNESNITQGVTDDSAMVSVNNNVSEPEIVPVKKKNLYEHPTPVISKTGLPWAKAEPRFDVKKIKVTKEDVKKIISS